MYRRVCHRLRRRRVRRPVRAAGAAVPVLRAPAAHRPRRLHAGLPAAHGRHRAQPPPQGAPLR